MAMTASMILRLRDKMSAPLKKNEQGLKRLGRTGQQALGRLNQGLGKVTKGLGALGISLGGAALIKQSVQAFVKFDNAMTAVAFKSGATAKEFGALREQAKELGATTQFSAGEAADAMENLATAGLSTNQILETTPKVLALAAAGKLSLAEASEIAATALKQFELNTSEAGRVSDVLARQANASMTNVSELGQALGNAGTNAKSLGVPMEEAVAALGGLADVGLRGAQGGTALSQVMARIKAPVAQAKKSLEQLGVSAYDSDGNFIGLTETMGLLNEALADKTVEEKQKYLTDIFGQEASTAANAYLGKVDQIKRAYQENQQAAGYADQAAQKMTDNLGGDLKSLASRWEALQITLTEGENAPLRGLVQNVSELLEKLNELAGDPKKMNALKSLLKIAGLGFMAYKGSSLIRFAGKKSALGGNATTGIAGMGAQSVFVTNWPAGGLGGLPGHKPGGGPSVPGSSPKGLPKSRGLGLTRGLKAGGVPLAMTLIAGAWEMFENQNIEDGRARARAQGEAFTGTALGALGAVAGGIFGGAAGAAIVGGLANYIGRKLGRNLVEQQQNSPEQQKADAIRNSAQANLSLSRQDFMAKQPELMPLKSTNGEVTIYLDAKVEEGTQLKLARPVQASPGYHVNTGRALEATP